MNNRELMLKSRRFAMVLNNELYIRKYEDPSHGWIAVPMQWLESLCIVGKITGYSYLRGNTAYLEEDIDASTFRKAAEAAGYRLFVDYRHTDERSSIRSYPSFTQVIAEQTELAAMVVAELNNESKGETMKKWLTIRNDFTNSKTRVDTSRPMTRKRAMTIRRRLCSDDCKSGDSLGSRGTQDDPIGYKDLLNRAEIAIMCGRTNLTINEGN